VSRTLLLEASRGAVSSIRVLFTVTVFTSAFLLFSVQPLFAKMPLPLFGSTPAVRNTCMVFFQAVLLGGYAVIHTTARLLPFRHQTTLHLGLLLAGVLALPVTLPAPWPAAPTDHPVWSRTKVFSCVPRRQLRNRRRLHWTSGCSISVVGEGMFCIDKSLPRRLSTHLQQHRAYHDGVEH